MSGRLREKVNGYLFVPEGNLCTLGFYIVIVSFCCFCVSVVFLWMDGICIVRLSISLYLISLSVSYSSLFLSGGFSFCLRSGVCLCPWSLVLIGHLFVCYLVLVFLFCWFYSYHMEGDDSVRRRRNTKNRYLAHITYMVVPY